MSYEEEDTFFAIWPTLSAGTQQCVLGLYTHISVLVGLFCFFSRSLLTLVRTRAVFAYKCVSILVCSRISSVNVGNSCMHMRRRMHATEDAS
jgi:hypothetical protein